MKYNKKQWTSIEINNKSIEINEHHWISLFFVHFQRFPMIFNDFYWFPMKIIANQWVFVFLWKTAILESISVLSNVHGFPKKIRIKANSISNTQNQWFLMISIDFYWFLLISIVFCWFLLVSIDFYCFLLISIDF